MDRALWPPSCGVFVLVVDLAGVVVAPRPSFLKVGFFPIFLTMLVACCHLAILWADVSVGRVSRSLLDVIPYFVVGPALFSIAQIPLDAFVLDLDPDLVVRVINRSLVSVCECQCLFTRVSADSDPSAAISGVVHSAPA